MKCSSKKFSRACTRKCCIKNKDVLQVVKKMYILYFILIIYFLLSDPEEQEKQEEKSESVDEQATGSKKRRRKRKSKANNRDVASAITDTAPKEKDTDITKNGMQNNSHDSKKNEKEDKDLKGNNVIDKSTKKKRENKVKTDDNGPVSKKICANNVETEHSHVNNVQIKVEKNIKVEKDNKEMSNTGIKKNKHEETPSVDKSAVSRKKKKNSKLSKVKKAGKHRPDGVDSMMSLNAERLKMYGINAKKFKNKLKYGNKKF